MCQILHITDLHIAHPEGDNEHLREAFFDEYLGTLVSRIEPHLTGNLDALIVTGDFVDKGKVSNFFHARKVLDFVIQKLRINPSKVAVCIGNHDIERTKEQGGDLSGAREKFRSFAAEFSNGSYTDQIDRAALIRMNSKLWCLMIDATLGSGGEDHPGTLEHTEADLLMGWIKKIPTDAVLIIGTHYPVHSYMGHGAPFDEDDPLWSKRHLWHQGEILAGRIRQLRERPQVMWLCGDIHKSVNISHNNQRFMATGRLGTMTGGADSQVRRQARLIQVVRPSAADAKLLQYVPMGHSSQPHLGSWIIVPEEFTNLLTNDPAVPHPPTPKKTRGQKVSKPLSTDLIAPGGDDLSKPDRNLEVGSVAPVRRPATTVPQEKLQVIEMNLQEELLRTIRESHLYHFGRFDTSETEVSLAWIPIGPLLNEGSILSSTINSMAKWLRRQIQCDDVATVESSVLLGMGCWGAVLASQLSVLTGIRNLCLAERGGGQHYVEAETLTSDLFGELRECQTFVLVSDVVATGLSLGRLHKKICVGIEGAKNARWLALSVLCDEAQNRSTDTSFLETHGTACKVLRMPILSADALPDESILPPIISFR